MAVRFVVGRAGSGKTWRCLEAIRARLCEDAAGGNKLLLLVPEQASFQMERAVIETPEISGYTRCEVLSFQRLAYRIFSHTGADPRRADQTIGSLGRLMVIRKLIDRDRRRLQLLGKVGDKPGLVKQLADNIDELIREKIEPELLADMADRCRGDNPLGSAKLGDLARIYQGYLDYLIDDRIDPAQYLNLAAERLDHCDWLDGAEVWVDGFAGFTQQEYELLVKLAGKAADTEITMLVDPSASAVEVDSYPGESYSLFARTERTLVQLRNMFNQAGVGIGGVVRLEASSFAKATEDKLPASRYLAPQLARLEGRLFNSRPGEEPLPVRPEVIQVVELSDRRVEVDAAVAEIERLTRQADPPMRYRDIAVIVRDLGAYHDLLSSAMRAHDIAYFIDRREPTTHHALIELVRGFLAVAADDCQLDSVRLLLKTGLIGLSNEESDLLENYLLAHGIDGVMVWKESWDYTRFFKQRGRDSKLSDAQQAVLVEVNRIREKFLGAVMSWLDTTDSHPRAEGRQWAQSLYACLEHLEVGAKLYEWADAAEADGRSDLADQHRQVWIDFVELLDEFVRALGGETMDIQTFRQTIESALAEFNLGLAPPTLDQVLVGAIERSRHPPVRAVLILGFDENHFPMIRSEDPLLGEPERELFESAGVKFGSTRRRQLIEERMLAYIALTRASERIWISCPRNDSEGRPIQPSPYLGDLLSALPGLEVERVGEPRAQRSKLWISRVAELGGRLAVEFRYRSRLEDETDAEVRAFWNALYDSVRGREDWGRTLARSMGGLKYKNVAELEEGAIEKSLPSTFSASVSRLERFAACPFAHFVEYTLGLQPRVEADLAEVDLGTLCHAILEKFVAGLNRQERRLADLEDDDIAERIDTVAGEVVNELGGEMLLDRPRNAYLCDRTRGHLGRVTRWQRDAARAGRFRSIAVEYPFGFSGDSAAPLTLKTPKGRTVYLRGYIDRVDIAELGNELIGTVIDYKRTTDKRLDLTEVYHGLALQLVGYLLALQQTGESLTGREIRPVAAFYLPLLESYTTVAHPSERKKTGYKWRGIADFSSLSALDSTVEPGKSSQFMSAAVTNKGEPYANSDLVRPEQLKALMRYVGLRMGELADGILDGDISVSPYRLRRRMPCSYCPYKSVCRYEIEAQLPRLLESMGKADVLKSAGEGCDG